MRIPYRERWLLRRVNRRLRQSDPHLAAMLAIFAALYHGEVIASREQATTPGVRAWRGLVLLVRPAARVVAALIARAGRTLRRAASTCAAVCRRLDEAARAALGMSSRARPPLRQDGPELPAN